MYTSTVFRGKKARRFESANKQELIDQAQEYDEATIVDVDGEVVYFLTLPPCLRHQAM